MAWLDHVKALGEAEKAMVNIGADHVNKLLAMSRQIAATGGGLQAGTYGAPYPGSTTNIGITPPQKPSSLPMIAGLLMGMTGLGVGAGTLYALKDKIGMPAMVVPPAATAPAAPQKFTVDIGFDPDKGGLQAGPVVPVK